MVDGLAAVCEKYHLSLVVLYGSQARGTARPDSDQDVGVLKQEGVVGEEEFLSLHLELSRALGLGNLDLVDLRRASPLLKYEAARTGRALYEARPGTFRLFHTLAWKLYQDDHFDLRRLDRLYVQRSLQRLLHDPG